MDPMPRPRLRPTNPVGIALTAYQLWRRLPPSQRKRLIQATRVHGPKLAAAIVARRRAARAARTAK
jgi:hypothetical protein